ncbi:MAG: hypothetical protein IPJ71_03620 [Bdellovibrionales bacterium]|nr:hypothetical protein [Bdellovibrionales bacterium]
MKNVSGKIAVYGCFALLLVGCTLSEPTPPSDGFIADIIPVTSFNSQTTLEEGKSLTLDFAFGRSVKITTVVIWEVAGGAGRLTGTTGRIELNAGEQEFSIELNSVINRRIDPPASLELKINSLSFEQPLSMTIELIDNTQPASLVVLAPLPLQLPTVVVGGTGSYLFEISNQGEIDASQMILNGLDVPYGFAGSVFPGTGGTCGTILAGGSSCAIQLEMAPTSGGSYSEQFNIEYFDGQQTVVIPVDLEGAGDGVVASLTGLPSLLSNDTTLDVTVGGGGITDYRYKFGPQASTDCASAIGYSVSSPTSSHITDSFSGYPDTTYRLCVVGYNGSNWQLFSSASRYSWTKDTTPPSSPFLAIEAGSTHTQNINATLDISSSDAQYMYVTNAPGCLIGGNWESYQSTKSWTLQSENSVNSVYIQFRDQIGNLSACISDSIIHDNLGPSVTVNQSASQADPTLSTPIFFDVHFSEVVDPNTFTVLDLQQLGTATEVIWRITSIDNQDFILEAFSINQGGTVIPKIISEGITDVAGNKNQASTSLDNQVIYNVVEFYFRDIFVGGSHSCAISNSNKTYCWGSNSEGQLGNGTNLANPIDSRVPSLVSTAGLEGGNHKGFERLSLSDYFSCALSFSRHSFCWGRAEEHDHGRGDAVNAYSDSNVPVSPNTSNTTYWNSHLGGVPYQNIRDITSGESHVCLINHDNKLFCWGNAGNGLLGNNENNSLNNYQVPVMVDISLISNYSHSKYLTAGRTHTCALAADNQVFCWGRNNYGQIGIGNVTDQLRPAQYVNTSGLTGFSGFISVSAGGYHSCGLSVDGKAYCWGRGDSGQLGNGIVSDQTLPVEVNTSSLSGNVRWIQLSAGQEHTCAIATDGRSFCWGKFSSGRLGTGSLSNEALPVQVMYGPGLQLMGLTKIAAGKEHTCGLRYDGKAFCWGHQGSEGRLGNNGTTPIEYPVSVAVDGLLSSQSFTQVSAGTDHTCALSSKGHVYCWGRGENGQLGGGVFTDPLPKLINESSLPANSGMIQISANGGHTCGITTLGSAYCWGIGTDGELGFGGVANQGTPVAVDVSGIINFPGFKKISSGLRHTCGLLGDGRAYCWGYGIFGQLGYGDIVSKTRPQLVDTSSIVDFKGFRDLSAGKHHTCGLSQENKVYCWGYGANGRLGYGLLSNKLLPYPVNDSSLPLNTYFSAVAVGGEHSCGVLSNGGGYCWGNGVQGQLGNGTQFDRLTPVSIDTSFISGFLGFKDLELGEVHSCATDLKGNPYCWGNGVYGRLGDGQDLNRIRPSFLDLSLVFDYQLTLGLSGGWEHGCAVGTYGQTYCWGRNQYGQLGNGSFVNDMSARKVSFP